MHSVNLTKIVDKMKLVNLTPDIDLNQIEVRRSDINRTALQLVGYFEHFEPDRVQIIGTVEYTYLTKMEQNEQVRVFTELMSYRMPCVVLCRGYEAHPYMIEAATRYGVPILATEKTTSSFTAEIIRWLNVQIAPSISIHGVLVDVYGEGILITGESGIGKSEAALELIRRGHRLVTDDVVEIRKVSDDTLIGLSPDITKNFIELRGIGIIDVKTLFGVECIKETSAIDLVIKLEDWHKDAEYDRLGLEEEYIEYLGNKVICHSIPIRPGRNLAIICESAAVNHRQKKMGYNAAQELYNRVQNSLKKG